MAAIASLAIILLFTYISSIPNEKTLSVAEKTIISPQDIGKDWEGRVYTNYSLSFENISSDAYYHGLGNASMGPSKPGMSVNLYLVVFNSTQDCENAFNKRYEEVSSLGEIVQLSNISIGDAGFTWMQNFLPNQTVGYNCLAFMKGDVLCIMGVDPRNGPPPYAGPLPWDYEALVQIAEIQLTKIQSNAT